MLFTTWGAVFEVLFVTIPVLISVAYVTVAERKTMASMQRRLGPNIVGSFGLLQAFADALKLLLKEYVSPAQSNFILFFTGPIITLIFALLGYLVIPFGPGSGLSDLNLGVLYMLAVSSLSTYGILLAGWSANSKYAFLGSLRSTAQLISYELILSSAILIVALLTGSLNITVMIEWQRAIIFLVPLLPIFIIFFIGSIAETNRAPFDLAEAESELVSGFMTEHAAVIFVFFFLAEYASIVLICILITVLFLGGYLYENLFNFIYIFFIYITKWPIFMFVFVQWIISIMLYQGFVCWFWLMGYITSLLCTFIFSHETYGWLYEVWYSYIPFDHWFTEKYFKQVITEGFNLFKKEACVILTWKTPEDLFDKTDGLLYGIAFGLKTCTMIFIFIWARASFPRIRFDQLMSFCWTILLPIVIAFVILVPCILYSFEIIPANIYLF